MVRRLRRVISTVAGDRKALGIVGQQTRDRGNELMVTTNRLISMDVFGSDPPEIVHLTGSVQVLARVTVGEPDAMPAHLEISLAAVRVRGVGLENGVQYQARGTYRIADDLGELPVSLNLVGTFELLRHQPADLPSTRLLLAAPFRVMVQADGRVRVEMKIPMLLPSPCG
jgi:hypothetical protein